MISAAVGSFILAGLGLAAGGDSRAQAVALLSEIESSRYVLAPLRMEVMEFVDYNGNANQGIRTYSVYADGLRARYELRWPIPPGAFRPLGGEADAAVTWDGSEFRKRYVIGVSEDRNFYGFRRLRMDTDFMGAFKPNPLGLDLPFAPAPYHLDLNRNLCLYQNVQGLEVIPETGDVKVFN